MIETYLVTGAAGFIGYFLSERLLKEGYKVVGVDNLNDYYDVNLKHTRLTLLKNHKNFIFLKLDISNKNDLEELFIKYRFDYVINLAAQAGVRYSIDHPDVYIQSNIIGFYNVLEMCRHYPVKHLVYASSSSVYGSNEKVPFEESDNVDHPVSLYAATKKSNELMAHTYTHLYGIPSTGLRFFTVYGPLGRPDMAYFNFVDRYFKNETIKIFNNGDFENDLYRDFTYIDDIVEGIFRVMRYSQASIKPSHTILNIGNNNPEKLMNFINTLEKCLSRSLGKRIEFIKKFEPIKLGDVHKTYASISKLEKMVGFKPTTSIERGLQKFTDWYVLYYKKV
ncbi:MAG TPA: SDR family NAD(P)-dependent oxidoreductase [Bacilli bacterium]|nr:SDR family NAD(P)-dependent oxidoreductase [Bacilli bacterium]